MQSTLIDEFLYGILSRFVFVILTWNANMKEFELLDTLMALLTTAMKGIEKDRILPIENQQLLASLFSTLNVRMIQEAAHPRRNGVKFRPVFDNNFLTPPLEQLMSRAPHITSIVGLTNAASGVLPKRMISLYSFESCFIRNRPTNCKYQRI